MNTVTKRLYRELLFMGRDYPMGFDFFRERLKRGFIRNKDVTDPDKLAQLHDRAQYVIKELEAMYKLRKYRFLKKNYYEFSDQDSEAIMKRLEAMAAATPDVPYVSRSRQNDEAIAKAAALLDPKVAVSPAAGKI